MPARACTPRILHMACMHAQWHQRVLKRMPLSLTYVISASCQTYNEIRDQNLNKLKTLGSSLKVRIICLCGDGKKDMISYIYCLLHRKYSIVKCCSDVSMCPVRVHCPQLQIHGGSGSSIESTTTKQVAWNATYLNTYDSMKQNTRFIG